MDAYSGTSWTYYPMTYDSLLKQQCMNRLGMSFFLLTWEKNCCIQTQTVYLSFWFEGTSGWWQNPAPLGSVRSPKLRPKRPKPCCQQVRIRNIDIIRALRPGVRSGDASDALNLRTHISEKELRSLFSKKGVLKNSLGKAHKGWTLLNLETVIASFRKLLQCSIPRTATFTFERRTGLDFQNGSRETNPGDNRTIPTDPFSDSWASLYSTPYRFCLMGFFGGWCSRFLFRKIMYTACTIHIYKYIHIFSICILTGH